MRKVVLQVVSNLELTELFFKDLKAYNSTNFRTIANADLSKADPVVHKAFSSVVTRYFIFCERHPEVSDTDCRILYFKLKIDNISRYFSEYPDIHLEWLSAFQLELKQYIENQKYKKLETSDKTTVVAEAATA